MGARKQANTECQIGVSDCACCARCHQTTGGRYHPMLPSGQARRDQQHIYYLSYHLHLLHIESNNDPSLSRAQQNYGSVNFERDLLRAFEIIWRNCIFVSYHQELTGRKHHWGVSGKTASKAKGLRGPPPACRPVPKKCRLSRDIICYHCLNTYTRCLCFNGRETKLPHNFL